MNSKPMLFECLNCKETYLADNLCEGYNCPKCNGRIIAIGFMHKIEEDLKDIKNKIKKAKKNGLIRNYYKYHIPPKPNLPLSPNNHISGVDLSGKKDNTVHTITINVNAENIDEDKLIEEIIRNLNNPKQPRRSGYIE